MRQDETEVLVVGAGPVGMLTALLLAEEGIRVQIIDKEWRPAAHSYACVLHTGALRLLDTLGLAKDVLAQGRRIESVAFYDGETRQAEMKLSALPGGFPFAVVIPQSAFENLLEQRLKEKGQTEIHWNHRLSELSFEQNAVVASIDKLKQTAKGYIVAEWEWTVQKQLQTRASFVVGADGHGSMVRSRLGLEYEQLAGPQLFAIFEFETLSEPGNEVRIAMNDAATNVVWPLPGNRSRWSFQLIKPKDAGDFPDKEREAFRVLQEEIDQNTKSYVERLAQKRAPWFNSGVKDVYWWSRIGFEHRLAKQFGKGCGWLVGDAAHQTGPVGVQSMNEGLLEAEDLAGKLKAVLRDHSSPAVLEDYGNVHRARWEKLLGVKGGLSAAASASAWVKNHCAKMLPCIPASGDDLGQLVRQAGLDF